MQFLKSKVQQLSVPTKLGGFCLLAGSLGQHFSSQLPLTAEAYPINIQEQKQKSLLKKKTQIYVWGNGFVSKQSRTFLNFKPKRLRFFSGPEPPQPINGAFGWYHEAYIDQKGRLFVAKKHKVFASKRKEVDDKAREFIEIKIPKGSKEKPQSYKIETYPAKAPRGSATIKQVCFSRLRLFALTNEGRVWSLPIEEYQVENDLGILNGKDLAHPITEGLLLPEQGRLIAELPLGIREISAGDSHFLALDKNGDIWVMGDDTFGQCGLNLEYNSTTQQYVPFSIRPTYPPFKSSKIPKPVKLPSEEKFVRIAAGFRHSLAISKSGKVYGWGWNNQQQLSHSEVFGNVKQQGSPGQGDQEPSTEPLFPQAFFSPVLIEYKLENRKAVDLAAGDQFSMIHTIHEESGLHQLFSTGNNLRGQLGINRLNHLSDMEKVEDISGLRDEKGNPIEITSLACGSTHCMATLAHGAFFTWGDNECAQRGTRNRVFIESPFPHNKFEYEHNVERIICGRDNSAAIVEYLPRRKLSYAQLKQKYKDAQPHELPDKLAMLKLERKKKEKRLEKEKKLKEKRLQKEKEINAQIQGGGWFQWVRSKVKKN